MPTISSDELLSSRAFSGYGRSFRQPRAPRRGAILPLFGVLLVVLLLIAGFAVNVACMQLTKTELRVATDAAARAGGRAFSEYQNVDQALTFTQQTAAANSVNGQPLIINTTDNTGDVEFGSSQRSNNGYGRYVFTKRNTSDVRSMDQMASSVRVTGRRTATSGSGYVRLPFPLFGTMSNFQPITSSIATQVDRDMALILDRSGSMAYSIFDWENYYEDELQLQWRYSRRRGWYQEWVEVRVWDPPAMEQHYNTYNQQYDRFLNNNGPVPDDSRWSALETAVDAFLDVLETTDQEEQVSLATFSSGATLDLQLQKTFQSIRNQVANRRPSGNTSIGAGMQTGMPSLLTSFARPYAAKTIVVLTDGVNNTNPTPVSVANSIMADHNVTIHTVTLSEEADQQTMQQVASIGQGKHYHASSEAALVDIFREIANNLPTIITE